MADALVVRVGIVSKNRPDYLRKCIQSCLAQTYEPKEIVVWDNSDEPHAIGANKQLAQEYPEVQWMRPERPTTLIEARKEMMQAASFDLFCSIDDDGWFMSGDELAVAAGLFAADGNLASVAFDILSPDRSEPAARRPPCETTFFVGCGHMLRRSMVQRIGSYADFPGWYGGEEKDLCIRLLENGWSVMFVPGVHVWHDKTEGDRDWCAQHRSGTLNDLTFALLRCPWPTVLTYLPGNALAHIRWGLLGRPEERWSGILGVCDFVRVAPAYFRKRQPVSTEVFRKFLGRGNKDREKPRTWEGKER